MIELHQSQFDIYALSLPSGLAFGNDIPKGAWLSADALTCGTLTANEENRTFGVLVMRRREDDVWTVTQRQAGVPREATARDLLRSWIVNGPRERVPPGVPRRPSLGDLTGVIPSNIFRSLGRPTH